MEELVRFALLDVRGVERDVGRPGRPSDSCERPTGQETVESEYGDIESLPPAGEEYFAELSRFELSRESDFVSRVWGGGERATGGY